MKRNTKRVSTIVAFLMTFSFLALPDLVVAQEQRAPDQHQEIQKRFAIKSCIEVGGSMGFMWSQPVRKGTTSDASMTFSAMPYVGYFIIDGLELGVNPLGVTVTRTPGVNNVPTTTETSLGIFFAPSYNFRFQSMVVPFVEGLAGYTAQITAPESGNSTTVGGFSWGGRAGVKLAIVERGLLVLGVQFVAVTENPSGQTERDGSNVLTVTAGFSIWL
jgi:hypothetical protein